MHANKVKVIRKEVATGWLDLFLDSEKTVLRSKQERSEQNFSAMDVKLFANEKDLWWKSSK